MTVVIFTFQNKSWPSMFSLTQCSVTYSFKFKLLSHIALSLEELIDIDGFQSKGIKGNTYCFIKQAILSLVQVFYLSIDTYCKVEHSFFQNSMSFVSLKSHQFQSKLPVILQINKHKIE